MSGALPVYDSPILGRQSDIHTLLALLRPDKAGARLLTLTGPAGVGKTRLAAQVAGLWQKTTGRRVTFVSLASLDDPSRLYTALAIAVDLQDTGSMPLATNLVEFLRDKRELIILDSFEHMRGGEALLNELLSTAQTVQFLVTSRAPVRLPGEVEYPVPPLTVPNLDKLPSAYILSNYPAVSLFLQRAQAAAPGFSLTQANAAAIAEICVHLDGLPLAIELAAARIDSIPPETMRERLQARLMLLIGNRLLPARHQTLRAAIDWSYDLLGPRQRSLFDRLSVFSGSAGAEAIQGICNPDGDTSALDADLQILVDQSLVRRTEPDRYAFLETVQEYGRERLAERGETARLHRSHLLYFAELAEKGEPELRGPDQLNWLARWRLELDNVRTALAWALDSGEPALGLRLASALHWFWFVRGYIAEGREWLEKLLAQLPRAPSALRGQALNSLARLTIQQDVNSAQRCCDEALTIWQALNNPRGLADAYYSLGRTAANRGDDPVQAAGYYQNSLQLYLDLENDLGVADVWFALGLLASNRGNTDLALVHFRQSLNLRRETGDTWGIARILTSLAFISADRYDFDEARRYDEESLALYEQLGDPVTAATVTLNQAYIEFHLGHYAGARGFAQEALSIWNDAGRRLRAISAYHQLAQIEIAEAHYNEAQPLVEHGMALSQRIGFNRGLAWMQLARAQIAFYQGDPDSALRSLADSLTLARRVNDKVNIAAALTTQSLALQQAHEPEAARSAVREGLQILQTSGDKTGLLNLIEALAPICATIGQPETAARLWGAAAANRARLETPLPPNRRPLYERQVAMARSAANPEFETAWQTGLALTLEQAVAQALTV